MEISPCLSFPRTHAVRFEGMGPFKRTCPTRYLSVRTKRTGTRLSEICSETACRQESDKNEDPEKAKENGLGRLSLGAKSPCDILNVLIALSQLIDGLLRVS
jgi:hypothetical protein